MDSWGEYWCVKTDQGIFERTRGKQTVMRTSKGGRGAMNAYDDLPPLSLATLESPIRTIYSSKKPMRIQSCWSLYPQQVVLLQKLRVCSTVVKLKELLALVCNIVWVFKCLLDCLHVELLLLLPSLYLKSRRLWNSAHLALDLVIQF